MVRNFFIALAIVGITSFGIIASPVAAQGVSDADARIKELLAKINDLTAQIERLRASVGQGTTSTMPQPDSSQHRVCAMLKRSLASGIQGDDVRGLQEFLAQEGFFAGTPTGYYGRLTEGAVRSWQAKEGVPTLGVFGPLSKGRMMMRCGEGVNKERFSASQTRGDAPLTVVFDTWLSGFRTSGITYVIDFGDGQSEGATSCSAPTDGCIAPGQNKHTYVSNGSYTATLNKITNPCAGMETLCKAAIRTEVVAKTQIFVGPIACTKDYRPVCGAKPIVCITTPCNPIPTNYGNKCMLEADGAQYLYSGECRSENPAENPQCKSWFDGCNSCSRNTYGGLAACTLKYCALESMQKSYCSAYFETAGNKPPVISGISGPTTIRAEASGTWTVNAKDPEGGQLSYQVWWGDENVYSPNYTTASAAREFVQATTFTHAYANAGTYTIAVTVRDSSGSEAKTTTTVRVGSDVSCTQEYAPVCGQPQMSCPSGMFCAMVMPAPQTYSNRCTMNAAGADFLSEGACSTQPIACTADAYQCPNGEWTGRSGPNCQFVCTL